MDAIAGFFTAHELFVVVMACVLVIAVGTIILGARPQRPFTPEVEGKLINSDPGAKQRMWDHFLNEDNIFNDRQNFFLVFESVLFGVIGAFYSKPAMDPSVLRLIALFGLAITLLWYYIQVRQLYVIDALKARNKKVFEEYKFTVNQRRPWPLHITGLLAYVQPLMITFAWVVFLAFLEGWHFGM